MISDERKGNKAMSISKHTEAEMIGALKQLEAGRKAEDVAGEVGVSKHTIYAWKAKYGGMDARSNHSSLLDSHVQQLTDRTVPSVCKSLPTARTRFG
jgi:transposase